MRVDGDFRNSTNANLARLLTDELARNSHAIVFDATHFITQGLTQAYTKVLTLNMSNTIQRLKNGTANAVPIEELRLQTNARALVRE
jgi:hypothetical protein